jgi:hypothetical protein
MDATTRILLFRSLFFLLHGDIYERAEAVKVVKKLLALSQKKMSRTNKERNFFFRTEVYVVLRAEAGGAGPRKEILQNSSSPSLLMLKTYRHPC